MDDSIINILLVEDNPDDAELTIRALIKHNIANHVHVVHDGEEALDLIFSRGQYANRTFPNFPKVVFLDLNLPRVGGLDVLRQIKSNEATQAIPVVVMSTSDEEQDVKECYRLGANSYIAKPINFENFLGIVSQLGFYWLLMNKNPL